jgi:hypothetical protein
MGVIYTPIRKSTVQRQQAAYPTVPINNPEICHTVVTAMLQNDYDDDITHTCVLTL